MINFKNNRARKRAGNSASIFTENPAKVIPNATSCARGWRAVIALTATLMLAAAGTQATPGQHTLTVTFNYDFTTDNACSATVTKGCVLQFNVYDVTTGTPVKLFSVPAPAGSTSAVTGITGTSGLLPLKSGVHTFGATAQMADGTESSPNASTATATVPPGSPASFSITVN
jgi:hypothetical protein